MLASLRRSLQNRCLLCSGCGSQLRRRPSPPAVHIVGVGRRMHYPCRLRATILKLELQTLSPCLYGAHARPMVFTSHIHARARDLGGLGRYICCKAACPLARPGFSIAVQQHTRQLYENQIIDADDEGRRLCCSQWCRRGQVVDVSNPVYK